MPTPLDREGTFRVHPVEVGLKKFDSGAAAVCVKFDVLAEWDGAGWNDWHQYEIQEVFGAFFVIKKDGSLHRSKIESVRQSLGWDGRFKSLVDGGWTPTDCQVTVEREEYKGTIRYKAAWVNLYDNVPYGNVGNASDADANAMDAKYGSQMRAIPSTVPTGKPPAPVGPASQSPVSESDVPF